MNPKETPSIAVIGCGIFGATTAIALQHAGFRVELFERSKKPLSGASFNNQNRLHLGFHYPRDIATAQQCIKGFDSFKYNFSEAIRGDFKNAYFIAKDKSLTSSKEYLSFCKKLGVYFEQFDTNTFPTEVVNVSTGILCKETVYDAQKLGEIVVKKLKANEIQIYCNTEIETMENVNNQIRVRTKSGNVKMFDGVVNTTYANSNRFTKQLGHSVIDNQYEYTVVPIIQIPFPETVGITIMDGAFMTLLPFGMSNNYLLYHVDQSVIERTTEECLPRGWLDKETSPFTTFNTETYFKEFVERCSYFLPALKEASLVGFLQGPRMVLAHREKTDTRPSVINAYQHNYISVFSGKIDHCTWVAEDIVKQFKENIVL